MPIYEYYCPDCHRVFNFYARSLTVTRQPACPKCERPNLRREVSIFAMTGTAQESESPTHAGLDEARMEQALGALEHEAQGINEDDPRQAAHLMKKLSKMTGMELTGTMKHALDRLAAGEDPDHIEADLGKAIAKEDPFLPGAHKEAQPKRPPPSRDETLYDL